MDAVRGRIRRGRLDSEHGEHGPGHVWVDAEDTDGPRRLEASRGPSETGEGPSPDQSRLVESLEDQVEYLRDQLGEEREARRRADMLLARLAEANASMAREIRELAAPERSPDGPELDAGGDTPMMMSTPEPPTEAQMTVQEPEREEETARRPWWLRILGG